MEECQLCKKGAVEARIKPRTAGYTVLSIDGGGARGIIPLQYLEMLQQGLGDSCQPQDLFDLVAGTSSGWPFPSFSKHSHLQLPGGLIALCMFLQNRSVAESKQQFVTMTRRVFRHNGDSLLKQVIKFSKRLFGDGAYDVTEFEACLKKTFGEYTRVFDHRKHANGVKVLVTASSISNGETFLFSNYNGKAKRQPHTGE